VAVAVVDEGTWDASVVGVGTAFDIMAQGFDPGTYVLRIDVANMEAGDELVVANALSGLAEVYPSEPKVVFTDAPPFAVYTGVTAEPAVVPAGGAVVTFAAAQTTGTARTYNWLLVRIF
jgi:hypothetical protein